MSRQALLVDRPGWVYLELPERLDERWVLGLTLPPGPVPVLLFAEDLRTATPQAVDLLVDRLCGREVAYVRLPGQVLAAIAPRLLEHAEMLAGDDR